MRSKTKLVPPDGGWGWMVVFGCSLINLSTRSIEPSFGLLFGDLFKDLGVATTGAALIVSSLDAIVNFSGLFVGPLIKKYSVRKVGFLGAFICAVGFTATSCAASTAHILVTYSIMGGLGVGLAQASTFVALHSYFHRRRGQAVGLAMTGTALGFMAMPHLISILLEEYGFHSTMLLVGAMSLNAVVGASLLQPVKWHMRTLEGSKEIKKLSEEGENNTSKSLLGIPRNNSVSSSVDQSKESISNVAKSSVLPTSSMSSFVVSRKRKVSTLSNVTNLDFMGSTLHVPLESESENEDNHYKLHGNVINNGVTHSCLNSNDSIKKFNNNKSKISCWDKFSTLMDLDLLLDAKYLNILFGVSIAYVAESNFKLIFPFFLQDLGYSKRETARALSYMAISDIIARIVIPPINDRLSFSRRNTLIVGLIFVSLARSVLAEQTSWRNIVISLMIHGFFRGYTIINFPLVISEAVVLEKFPAAYGLSMVAKGIFMVVLGPVAGWVRDYTESYAITLHMQSFMMISCAIAWLIEYAMCFNKKTKETINIELT